MTDRTIPQNTDAEQAVLGSILFTGADAMDTAISSGLTAESFYTPAHGLVWDACVAQIRTSKSVDTITVAEQLERDGKLDAAGGRVGLDRLVDASAIPSHLPDYIEIVSNRALARSILGTLRSAANDIYDGELDVEEIRSRAEYELALTTGIKTPPTPREIMTAQVDIWRDSQENNWSGLETGWPMLDRLLGGLQPCGYYVLSGGEGVGKTTLARNICEHNARTGVPVGLATLEQSCRNIYGASLATASEQSVFELNGGQRSANVESAASFIEPVANWPLYVDDTLHSPSTLFSWARRLVSKQNVKLITLDYLQIMRPDPGKKYGSKEEMMTDFSGCCREIAKELGISVVALSSLSYDGNARYSRQIGYDAWVHLRLEKNMDEWERGNWMVDGTVLKHRFGPSGSEFQMRLNPNRSRFEMGIEQQTQAQTGPEGVWEP